MSYGRRTGPKARGSARACGACAAVLLLSAVAQAGDAADKPAPSAAEAATQPAGEWTTQKVGQITVRVPATWKQLYNAADGAGWYLGKLDSPEASFTVVREESVSGYTSGLHVLRRRAIGVSGHAGVFYDGVSKDGRVRLWVLLTKERLKDGKRAAFVAGSPNALWARHDAAYRAIFRSITIPGGTDTGEQIATSPPWEKGAASTQPVKVPPVKITCGEITLRLPAAWRQMKGSPKGEGCWYAGKADAPQASFSIVREKDFAAYTGKFVVRRKSAVGVSGHAATFMDCAGKDGRYTMWLLILAEPGDDGRRIGFVAASPGEHWAKHEGDYKAAFQSIEIPGGKAAGAQIASAPPWRAAKPQPPESKPSKGEPPKPAKPEPATTRPVVGRVTRKFLPPILARLLRPGEERAPSTQPAAAPELMLESKAFAHGRPVPKVHTGDGKDLSPPLVWANLPSGTKALALVVDDPDAPGAEPWVHWVIYNLPPEAGGLDEGLPTSAALKKPAGAMQGKNSWGTVGYRGPAPPPGHGVHHYRFRLYALDEALKLGPGLTKNALLKAVSGHVLARAELVGTHQR